MVRDADVLAARGSSNGPRHSGVNREPIALIGIGCRFPGGVVDAESFWSLLAEGRDAITEVPANRWNIDAFFDPDPAVPDKMYTRWGGFIDSVEMFDAQYFGISPREAAYVDPQQRLVLEVALEALEDGGQVPEKLAGSNTGVFIGISTHDYGDLQIMDPTRVPNKDILAGLYGGTGGVLSIAANRISYCLNLQGPSIAVDTACSSGLVATHLAAQSIWKGECDLALAGGVNCILSPTVTVAFCKAQMLSPDGRSKAFDARANGYVRGEGTGIVVLKPLSRALKDGDPIYAVVRGGAVNQDGRTQGLTVPSREAQEALLRDAYAEAGVPLRRVRYVEAHGTGTPVGDPIEAGAIGEVLGRGRDGKQPLLIGSVKTNIGHLEAASGAAGLIKAALLLKNRAVPPSLHFQEPNPKIDFSELHLQVPTSIERLPDGEGAAVVGVNSFGFGGTNAHVILEEAPPRGAGRSREPEQEGRPYLFTVSGRTPEALEAAVKAYAQYLTACPEVALKDVAYSAGLRRSHHEQRLALVAESRERLAENLQAFISGESRAHMFAGRQASGQRPKLTFVFSGMGPQWWGMGRELFQEERVFRAAIERCDALLSKLAPWSLVTEMLADESNSRVNQTEFAQPANFALQVALAELLRSYGIEPDAILGHSAGEVAAAHVAGALTLEDAVTIVYHRSRLQQRTSGKGRMLAVGLSLAEARRELEGWTDKVSLAAINGPASVTFSGDEDALDEIARSLEGRQVFARLLPGSVPYHSRHMDPLEGELVEALRKIKPLSPSIPICSVVTGALAEDQLFDASYWWRNVRQSVRFTDALDALIGEGHRLFLELSPHPVLARDIASVLAAHDQKGSILPTLRRDEGERTGLLASLGALHVQGFALEWSHVNGDDARFVRLPVYPWQREPYWHETEGARRFRLAASAHPLLGSRQDSAHPTWQADLESRALDYLEEHALLDTVLFPATGFLEMLLAARKEMSGSEACIVEDVEIKRPLVLVDRSATSVQLVHDPQESSINIFSRVGGSASWTLNTSARLSRERTAREPLRFSPREMMGRFSREISGEECYRYFERCGLQYGPRFQGIEKVWTADGESLARICVPASLEDSELGQYQFHPALLDCCLQLVHFLKERKDGVFLPVRLDRATLLRRPKPGEMWTHARLVGQGDSDIEAEVRVADAEGVVAEFKGVRAQFVASNAGSLEDLSDCLFRFGWYAKSRPGMAVRPINDLPGPAEAARLLQPLVAQLSAQFERRRAYEIFDPELDRLSSAYVVDAVVALGWELVPGQRVAADDLLSRLNIAAQFEQLFNRMLSMLEEDGVLQREGDDWRVLRPPPVIDAEAFRSELLDSYSEQTPLLDLMGRCGPKLTEVLRGELPAVELVFPGGSMDLAENVYQNSPGFLIYNLLLQKALGGRFEHLPADRVMRVVEVGAGTGGTTARLLPGLPPGSTEYVFTDVSNTFTGFAQQKFRDFPFAQYRLLDIELDPELQGFQPHSFDIVIAAAVLHATRNLRESLDNVKRLLAPNGLLLLVEPTKAWRPLDLVFGLLSGWWRFEDYDLRPSHPLIAPAAWDSLLTTSGFTQVETVTEVTPASDSLLSLFIAQAPAVEEQVLREEASLRLPTEPGSWLIYADSGGVGQNLADLLDAYGESCIIVTPGESYKLLDDTHCQVRPDSGEDAAQLLSYVQAEWPTCRGVVYCWNLEATRSQSLTAKERAEAHLYGTVSVLCLVQGLAQAGWPAQPALWLVTRGAQAVKAGEEIALFQSPVWGLGRVIMNEQPQLHCTLVDLDPRAERQAAAFLFGELWSDDGEQEVAYRLDARYVNRLVRVSRQALGEGERMEAVEPGSIPYRVEPAKPGILDSLRLREVARRDPGAGEVEIEVHAAGLNFRDVMKVMGLYPLVLEDESAAWLGDECAGIVTRIGDGVTEFKVGDEVVAIGPGTFSAYVTMATTYVVRKPPGLSFEQAATVAIVFLTAQYALNHVGRLARGERVLIHAAAGGVGIAAVQLCQAAGAEIFATAGSPEKRRFLESLGIEHVMDDRTLDFADQVMELTRGRGVDVVLNSLAGEFIPKSLSVLGLGGRFLELGKVDIYRNGRLGLWPFRNGLSFCAIDLVSVLHERPALVRQLLADVMAKIAAGELRPLPVKVFPVDDVVGAFRFMSQARQIGKIALSMRDGPTPVARTPRREPLFKEDATYLMSGGLGGFGLAAAEWMVESGARHLVLLGRRGASTREARDAVERMQKQGAEVVVGKVDVTREDEVAGILAATAETMPPLQGVVHAAMVLDDGMLLSLDRERFERVMAPKVEGAWNLHTQTLDLPLDFFVNFSSFSAIVGMPGQGNYAAANVFLDNLALHRKALGLPGLSVNWGAIGDVGYVAQHGDVYRLFERQGFIPFKARDAMAILQRLMSLPLGQVGAARANIPQLASYYQQFAPASRMSHLAASEAKSSQGGEIHKGQRGWLRNALAGASPADREQLLESFLREQLAEVLGASPAKLDLHQPLSGLGLDSLMAVQMETLIQVEAGVTLPTGYLLAADVSMADVVQKVVAMASPVASGTSGSGTGPAK